jgi:hypothetical protein
MSWVGLLSVVAWLAATFAALAELLAAKDKAFVAYEGFVVRPFAADKLALFALYRQSAFAAG